MVLKRAAMITTRTPAKALVPELLLARTEELEGAAVVVPLADVSVEVSDAVAVEDTSVKVVEPVAEPSTVADGPLVPVPTGIGILAPVVALAPAGPGMAAAAPEEAGTNGVAPEAELEFSTGLATGVGAPGVMVAIRQISICLMAITSSQVWIIPPADGTL